MPVRAVAYARYSSDLQNAASIEDQLRLCRAYAERQGWVIADSYVDRAISGASLLRPGIQDLISSAAKGCFDVVVSEALDRLSRDQEDIAGLFKRLTFAGVQIFTVAEGEVSQIHIGLKGTMNALFLKDLALKTHRGLRGRVEAGKSGGGNSYGYAVVRSFGSDGAPIAGERRIDLAQADVIRRIFSDFGNGRSPRGIAHSLNKEGISGPRGEAWGQSTINGNATRGTGILNNELYVGRLVWNRLHYLKDPESGKRISRLNPPESWVTVDAPELRIVDQGLWDSVKERQAKVTLRRKVSSDGSGTPARIAGFWSHQRPRYLLTGLMKCGACGGGYTKLSANLFGCAAVRNKGTCNNRLNIRTDVLETIVFDGLKHRLMSPELFKEFAAAFVAERNAIAAQQNNKFDEARADLSRIKTRLKALVNALADGLSARSVKDEMLALEAREDEINAMLAGKPSREPTLMPNFADLYRSKVAALHEALASPSTRDEASSIIRSLIDEVRLIPEEGKLRVELRGALAGILALAYGDPKHLRRGSDGSVSVLAEQVKLVAGACNHLY